MAKNTFLRDALRDAMESRGLGPADLARELGRRPETIANLYNGTVTRPQHALRDALDDYLAGGVRGVTWQICEGRRRRYPSASVSELVALVEPMPAEAIEHLVGLLRELTRPGG